MNDRRIFLTAEDLKADGFVSGADLQIGDIVQYMATVPANFDYTNDRYTEETVSHRIKVIPVFEEVSSLQQIKEFLENSLNMRSVDANFTLNNSNIACSIQKAYQSYNGNWNSFSDNIDGAIYNMVPQQDVWLDLYDYLVQTIDSSQGYIERKQTSTSGSDITFTYTYWRGNGAASQSSGKFRCRAYNDNTSFVCRTREAALGYRIQPLGKVVYGSNICNPFITVWENGRQGMGIQVSGYLLFGIFKGWQIVSMENIPDNWYFKLAEE